ALWLLPAAAAPQRRRSRGPAAQAGVRAGAPQAAARFSRAQRRRRAHPALFSAGFHAGQRAAHRPAGNEAAAAARGGVTMRTVMIFLCAATVAAATPEDEIRRNWARQITQ